MCVVYHTLSNVDCRRLLQWQDFGGASHVPDVKYTMQRVANRQTRGNLVLYRVWYAKLGLFSQGI
jgi:hypothetical protein